MPKLAIVDGHSLLYRGYHAMYGTTLITSSGELTSATFAFTSMLLKAVIDLRPDYVVVAFDPGGRLRRHDLYNDYKSNRTAEAVDDLWMQYPRIQEIVQAFGFPIVTCLGYEGDDILGTLAVQATAQGVETILLTGDHDTLQLVNDSVSAYIFKRGVSEMIRYDSPAVLEKMKVRPDQIPCYKGLVGDVTDAIPGVRGFGEVTTSKLLAQYGSLEGIYEHLPELKPRIAQLLVDNRDIAFLSRKLGTIDTNAPIQLCLEEARVGQYDVPKLQALFEMLEFRGFIKKLAILTGTSVAPMYDPTTPIGMVQVLPIPTNIYRKAPDPRRQSVDVGPETLVQVVETLGDLQACMTAIWSSKELSFDTETTGLDMPTLELVGISLSTQEGTAWYIPVGHKLERERQLPLTDVLCVLQPVLEDPHVRKYMHNAKYDMAVMAKYGIEVQGLAMDTMVGAYLLDPGISGKGLKEQTKTRLGIVMTEITDIVNFRKGMTMADVGIDIAAPYAGADADMTLRLVQPIVQELSRWKLMDLYQQIEQPIIPILRDMEREGVLVDGEFIREYGVKVSAKISELELAIYESAGRSFNLSSDQQLAQILFGDLKLTPTRRTKRGYAVGKYELASLQELHPIIPLVQEWRQLTKLRSTYIDGLLKLIHPVTGRVHTSFNQIVTASGRLSSSHPNLQNIPIKSEVGKLIRRAFIARPGYKLVKADFSQAELRILTHVTQDPVYLRLFAEGVDVHTITASQLYQVPESEVTWLQRKIAKNVSFAILYGQSPHGLAEMLGIPEIDAATFIKRYHMTYKTVKGYIASVTEQLHKQGFVNTFFGRKRFFTDLSGDLAAHEREAINSPIQGGCADLMKLSLIAINRELKARSSDARIVLTVHDEVLLEVPNEEALDIARLVWRIMSNVVKLDVPMESSVSVGSNWLEQVELD